MKYWKLQVELRLIRQFVLSFGFFLFVFFSVACNCFSWKEKESDSFVCCKHVGALKYKDTQLALETLHV